jgi:spore maturation protein A
MLNYIWAGMLLVGFVVSIFTGKIDETTQAAIETSGNAVQIAISLLGIMCLWTGIMNIVNKSGLINIIARYIKPFTSLLFPEISYRAPAMGAMVLNMVANMMGLSNAATPLGLKAMKELDKMNRNKSIASNAMCMFVVINTASIQIIPATVIALRASVGSNAPFEIIVTSWISSICALVVGVTAAKIMQIRR